MLQNRVETKAAQFTAAYQALKGKKDTERLLALIKPMILSAKADGISDRELIELINRLDLPERFYPTKLKELRARLGQAEPAATVIDEHEKQPANPDPIHPLAAAVRGRFNAAAV